MKIRQLINKLRDTARRNPKLMMALLAILLLALPWASASVYFRHLLILCSVYVILTTSLNLIMGYTGQLSLGHAAFYGIGAYTFALLVLKTGTNYWVAFLAGGVIAALFAGFLGTIVLRLKGHYLAIVTLAFGEIVRVTLYNWVDLTRGPMGLTDIPRPTIFAYQFRGTLPYYYLGLLLAVIAVLAFRQLIHSRFGRSFIAIRDEENAAIAMGISATKVKVLSFVVGSFFAGLAGSFLASYIRFIHPDNFTAWESLILNAMVVIGGEGNLIGSILGAIVLTVLPEMLRVASQFRMVIYAVIMIASIILWPYGLAGKPKEKELDEAEKEEAKRLKELAAKQISLGGAHPEVSSDIGPMDGRGNILVVKDLTKIFGGLVAVNKVSTEVKERSIHSIIGPNGAGKTTFFNMLSGFYKPQSGSILFNGKEIVGLKPDEISRLGMARTFQKIRLFVSMTALENVTLACDARMKENLFDAFFHTPRMMKEERAVHEYALQLLQFVGLSDKRYTLSKNLSYGDQRRLEIARALATGLKLLLLDEPTAGMSPEETQEVIELIQNLRDEWGLTVILIEHDMKVVMGISDKITVLDHGQKIAEGKPKEIQNNQLVIEAYLGAEPAVAQ